MLKTCTLYSGSSGNSIYVESKNTKILIDVGVSCKKILEALEQIKVNILDINAILITHEHIDHTKALNLLSSKFNIPVYCNKLTWDALKLTCPVQKNTFTNNEFFEIGDLKIFPFSTSHDAADPCGFNIYNQNSKITIATDIGCVSSNLLKNLENSSLLFVESNYDPEVLKMSSYPYKLKQRIASNIGHLDNYSAGKIIGFLSNNGLKDAILIHLSKENNFSELALATVNEELQKTNKEIKTNIYIAPRNEPSKFFEVI